MVVEHVLALWAEWLDHELWSVASARALPTIDHFNVTTKRVHFAYLVSHACSMRQLESFEGPATSDDHTN